VTWAPRPEPPPRAWVVAKWVVLAGGAGLMLLLVARPELGARLLWYAIIPLLPAVFLLNAELWRNVCPLATLGTLREPSVTRPLTRDRAARSAVLGLVLFVVLVPARVTLFNDSGRASSLLLGTAALAAMGAGLVLDRKAGFCNSVCPILPVERLYGQRPMITVVNARCAPCRACTQHACFDLNPERSGLVSLGTAARQRSWIVTPFGAFALALPGFVTAYSVAPPLLAVDGLAVYAALVGGAAASWAFLALFFTALSTRPARALVAAAALAVGAYYWFTPPAVVEAWSLHESWTAVFRLATLALVAVWTIRSLRRDPRRPTTR
jgi:nitrite reductase (NADH) large subunit